MKGSRSGWKGESRRHSLARKGVKTARGCATKPRKSMGRKELGSSLSPEGKALLKSDGYSEDYIPYIWKEELETGTQPNSPYYLTIDFVLDPEKREEYNELRDDEETDGFTGDWFSYNLWELIEKGFIMDVYDDSNNPNQINSPEELKAKYDQIVLIYGGY